MGFTNGLTNFRLLYSCWKLVLFVFLLLLPIFNWTFLMVTTLLSIILSAAIAKFSVTKANDEAVLNIFGIEDGFKSPGIVDNSDSNYSDCLKVFAHRACGLDAPENSISALKKVIAEGYKGVEFDVMLTADNVAVVFHDETLLRMAQDSRKLCSVTYNDLQELEISSKLQFGDKYAGEKIPLLSTFVQYCIEHNIKMIIDLKFGDPNKLVQVIIQLFEDNPQLVHLAIISSFNPLLIYKIRKLNPAIVGCLAWRSSFYTHCGVDETGPIDPRSNSRIIQFGQSIFDRIHCWFYRNVFYLLLGLSAVLLHKDLITREVISYWKQRNVRVLAWTVNQPLEKEYFERVLKIPYLTDTVIRR